MTEISNFEDLALLFKDSTEEGTDKVGRKKEYLRMVKHECIKRERSLLRKSLILAGKYQNIYNEWFEWTQCDNPEYNKYYKNLKTDVIENFAAYVEVNSMLSDDSSKKCLFDICRWRLTRESKYLVESYAQSRNEQYFEPFLHLTDAEIFVDCGGYIGDSTMALIKNKGGILKGYLYDADKNNMMRAKDNLKDFNIIFRNVGVGEKRDTLCFNGLGLGSSSFTFEDDSSEHSEKEYVDIVTIDEDIPLDVKISFIKMDIEGMELQALKGAINHIKQDRPVLAICLYHNVQDIWTIPLYIKCVVGSGYKFFIRHYTLYHEETVFYAVPNERFRKP